MEMQPRRREPEPEPMDPERRYVEKVKADVRRFLAWRGIEARVEDKTNRHGEVVIGVILARQYPY